MENEELDLFKFEDPVEDIQQQEPNSIEEPEIDYEDEEYNHSNTEDNDYISQLLKAKGIDKDKVQIYDEEGNLTEMKFEDLDEDQKFDLLNSEIPQQDSLLNDDEIEVINYLRKNKMTLSDFAEWQKQKGIEEYLSEHQETSNDFDGYNDEEIIAYDLIQRFGEEMSDEEIDAEIERLKADPEAFTKRVTLLRNSYKSEAEAQAKLYAEQEQTKIKADEEMFKNAYINAAKNITDIQGITLEDVDKSELLNFVLEKDEANRTAFSKAMDSPENVLKMAWALLHGEEAFNATVDYFKKEISKREKSTTRPRVVNKNNRSKQSDVFSFE